MRWVYPAVGIHRPVVEGQALAIRGARWRTASTELVNAGEAMGKIISNVQAANKGPGVDEFTTFMSGTTASPDAISKAAADSGEFAAACDTVAQELAEVLAALDAAATVADERIHNQPGYIGPNHTVYVLGVLAEARQKMATLQAIAAANIALAFAFGVDIPSGSLPETVNVGAFNAERGVVSPEVAALWSQLSESEREAVLKQIAIQHAAENGVTLDPEDVRVGPPTTKDAGKESANGVRYSDEIWLNTAEGRLNDPRLIHTAAHEAQHMVQAAAVEEYEGYSAAELDEMRDRNENPFSEYGLTIDEVEAISREEYESDPFSDYIANPSEVDARESGRNAAGMTEEEFRAIMDAAGVQV